MIPTGSLRFKSSKNRYCIIYSNCLEIPVRKLLSILLASSFCFPVIALAQSRNAAQVSKNKIVKARPLPLNDVRLLGGPLKIAQDLDAKYLLELEPDRMLSFLRLRAGLEPKAKGYGGRDVPGRQLKGHIAGQYLCAVSLMWAATGGVRFNESAQDNVKALQT